ncbi:hypothetical protein V1525DRAFT_393259 [Lipomyces kononenkoae]|uniref:Uncharacterized protein n=1 Tax=Lipomyces kononenkoae TaxID=34357 RepID=A0ACC3TB09_LIPKO
MAASNSRLPSNKVTDRAGPLPSDSNLSVPTGRKYSQAGYSSADPSEYESETPKEDAQDYQQRIVHEQSPPAANPHGIQHRRLSHRHVGHNRPSIQDTKWKLYDPQPLLSNLVHHDKHTPAEGDQPKSPEPQRAKHHLWHRYHHAATTTQSQPDNNLPSAGSGIDRPPMQFRTPTYDKSHYTFSAAGNNTRLLLQQDNILSPPLFSPHERPWTQDMDQFPGPDDEADTESDNSPPKPLFLRRRSSTNYQTELNARRAEGRSNSDEFADNDVSSTTTTSYVKALEDRISAIKIGGRRDDHAVATVPPPTTGHQYRMALPSKHHTNTFYDAEFSRGSQESDEVRPLHVGERLHGSQTSNHEDIPSELEDDLLRRKSADGEFESIEAFAMAGSVRPDTANDGSVPTRPSLPNRQKTFDYNDYRNHFHGLLMTPEEEKKPGFSCTD